ncbi:MAG: ComEC/Rec2 family competence protein [Bacteroidales bacterium]|nr:ComEC/Rec2 family competence protein [Bacteroidales bacterium]
MKGRFDIEIYSAAFVAGDILAGIISGAVRPAITLSAFLLAPLLAVVAARRRWRAAAASALLMLGALNASLGRYPAGQTALERWADMLKTDISHRLDTLAEGGGEGAILSAIAVGDKGRINHSLKTEFKSSGAMHLIALSGLHVGVLYLFITITLGLFGNSPPMRRLRKAVTLMLLWSYAVMTGLSNSILRAVIMITVYETGELLGSRRNLIRALAISALVTTLSNPDAPFSIGFQLSYGAMAGIGIIYPRLKTMLECRTSIMQKIWGTVALSLSCQAATAPLVWLYFGTFPRYFLITNFVAIPLTSAAIYLTPLAMITKNLPVAGDFLQGALRLSLRLLRSAIHIIAGL